MILCVYVVLSCVGRGLYAGLITRPEESYRVSNVMCVIKKPQKRRPRPDLGRTAIGRKVRDTTFNGGKLK
jgi:hypothetical protein